MSSSACFVQECPTCGRRLQIRVEYLGKKVVCLHCHGKLEARDPASRGVAQVDSDNTLLRRADELLQHAAEAVVHSRVPHPR